MPRGALQLISSGGLYGAERVAIDLARCLRAAGWTSLLGVIDGPTPAARQVLHAARQAGLDAELLPCRGRADPRTGRALARLVRRHDVALVHGHGYKPDVIMRLTPLPRATRRVATCHTWYSHSPRLAAYEWLDKRALRGFDHVAVVSPALLDEVRRAGVPRRRSSLVLNGVDAPSPPPPGATGRLRRELDLEPDRPLVLRLCRLDPDKRIGLLLRSWPSVLARAGASARPARLVAGDGARGPALRARVRALDLERDVRLVGFRSDADILLAAADLMVISSDAEGLPLALLEAMAAGLPVVATAVGAIPAVLRDGRDALLVPPGDPRALARAITAAIRDPAASARRAARARRTYARDHTRHAMGQRYLAIYDGIGAAP